MIRIFGTGKVSKVEARTAGEHKYLKIRIGAPDRGKTDGKWGTFYTNVDALVWRGNEFLSKLSEGDMVAFSGMPRIETWEGKLWRELNPA